MKKNQLLVSVRDAGEAQICLANSVDILDLKEPNAGALGAVDQGVMERVSLLVNELEPRRRPQTSFAVGELVDWDFNKSPRLVDCYPAALLARFQFVKIGLAGAVQLTDWPGRWDQLFQGLPDSIQPVSVGYFDFANVDAPAIDRVLDFAIENRRVQTVLLDTFGKPGSLFNWVSDLELADIIQTCRRNNLQTVIAGSVSQRQLDRVTDLRPDYIGVRGAVCRDGRATRVCEESLQSFQRKLRPG